MEILVPAECTLAGYDIRTESLEVYEALLAAAPDPYEVGGHVGTPDKDGIAKAERKFFYHPEDDPELTVWVRGPEKRVRVTVEDV